MHKDHANEQISEIKQETISNGNKFNEETRQDYQELIDKAIFSFVGIPSLIGFLLNRWYYQPLWIVVMYFLL